MKKIIKSRIFLVAITAILCTCIGVYAANQYNASQITYNKNGQTTVETALNDLYNKKNNYDITPIISTSKGVFNISKGLKKAYIVFLNATSGNQEYTFGVSGDILIGNPTKITSDSGVDTGLWDGLYIYEVELSGEEGTLTCTATGANGDSRGYKFLMFY